MIMSTRVLPTVALVALTLTSPCLEAYQIATDLSYTTTPTAVNGGTVSGYSRTWKDAWDTNSDWYCGYWVWDDVYGYYCYAYVTEVYWASVQYADLYSPSMSSYHHEYVYDLRDALSDYSTDQPTASSASELWTGQGQHYMEREYYVTYCPNGFCFPPAYAGTDWVHLGNTADQLTTACISQGSPQTGTLYGANSLSDNGTGYYHFLGSDAPDSDDWGCSNYANQKVAGVGLWWNQSPRMGIGDISRQGGGSFPPHGSHQNGLDIDVRYVRNDGQEGPLDFDQNPTAYDQAQTQSLVDRYCTLAGASVVYADARANLTASCVNTSDPTHFNHFHVRLPDVDGVN
jgi:hypothetical protein